MTLEVPVLVPLLLLGAVLALAVPLALLRLPAAAPLAVYAFVLPWGSALSFPGVPEPFNTPSTVVGLLLTFALLLRLVTSWRSTPRVEPSVLLWVALFGWLLLTVLWSVDPRRSLARLALLSGLVALFVLGSLVGLRRQELVWIELGAVAGALVVAAQALLTAASGGLDSTSSRLPRFTYDDGDPNILAASLLLPLALAVWWSLTGTDAGRRWAASGASIALFCAILVTGSRGGVLSALVVLVVLLALAPGLPLLRLGGYLAGLLGLLTVTLLALPDGLRSHLGQTGSTGRSDVWRIGLEACASTCDTGSGFGTFGVVYQEIYRSELSLEGLGDRTYAAHNVFLSIAVEAGLPGLLLMVGAFALLLSGLLRLSRRARGPALGAVAGLLVSNMLVSNLGFKYFWMTLLYATLCLRVHDRQPAAAPSGAGGQRGVVAAPTS